jgi:folate-binding protein YgfZ
MTALLDRAGRLQAFGFLRKRPDRIDLLVPAAAAESAMSFLEAHIIADDVSLRLVDTGDLSLLLGAEAVRLIPELPAGSTMPIEGWGSRGCVTWGASPPTFPTIGDDELEARRVLSGVPRWGVEAAAGQLIHETSLIGPAVSMTKGCFLGQETVAKVASGRGAARAPVLLEIVSGIPTDADGFSGDFAAEGHDRAGTVLAVTRWEDRTYLLSRVIREMRVENREVDCLWGGGESCTVRVRPLPLLTTPDPRYWATRLQLRAVEAFSYDR